MPERCFFALETSRAIDDCLDRARRAFVSVAPAWSDQKWVRPEVQHVTVKFIGPFADASVSPLLEDLGDVLAGIGPVRLVPSGVRAMPSMRRATMLWATLSGDVEAAGVIHERVDALLAVRFGVPADERRFHPHLTMVRTRSPRAVPLDALRAADDALVGCGKHPERFVSVPSLTLIASTLGPGGPAYRTLGEVPLGGAR